MEIPRLVKCFLCGRWSHQKALFQIGVEDQGGGWIVKLACQGCLDVAGNVDRIPFEDQGKKFALK